MALAERRTPAMSVELEQLPPKAPTQVSVHFCAAHLRYVLFCAISRQFLRFTHDFQYRSCDSKTSYDSAVPVNFRDFQAAISHHGAQI